MYSAFYTNNDGLIRDISGLSSHNQEGIWLLGPGANPNPITPGYGQQTYGPCINECINDAVECGRDADEAYAVAIRASSVQWATGNLVGAVTTALVATMQHRRSQKTCVRSFNRCVENCD